MVRTSCHCHCSISCHLPSIYVSSISPQNPTPPSWASYVPLRKKLITKQPPGSKAIPFETHSRYNRRSEEKLLSTYYNTLWRAAKTSQPLASRQAWTRALLLHKLTGAHCCAKFAKIGGWWPMKMCFLHMFWILRLSSIGLNTRGRQRLGKETVCPHCLFKSASPRVMPKIHYKWKHVNEY